MLIFMRMQVKNSTFQKMFILLVQWTTEIANTEGLNENYQIGASYFLKLKTIDFDQLWIDYLHPRLQEYINGMYDEEGIMERFIKAYGYRISDGVDNDEPN